MRRTRATRVRARSWPWSASAARFVLREGALQALPPDTQPRPRVWWRWWLGQPEPFSAWLYRDSPEAVAAFELVLAHFAEFTATQDDPIAKRDGRASPPRAGLLGLLNEDHDCGAKQDEPKRRECAENQTGNGNQRAHANFSPVPHPYRHLSKRVATCHHDHGEQQDDKADSAADEHSRVARSEHEHCNADRDWKEDHGPGPIEDPRQVSTNKRFRDFRSGVGRVNALTTHWSAENTS